jgi:deoxyribose-phosphate aldolase
VSPLPPAPGAGDPAPDVAPAPGTSSAADLGTGPAPGIDLAPYIDHTLLRPTATPAEIDRLVAEASAHGFAAVCLPPVHVARAARGLAGSAVRTGTVIGFPLGWVHPESRRDESRRAIADGAEELDTMWNLSWFLGGEDQRVLDDLAAWVAAARAERRDLTLKIILETSLLDDEQKVRGARLVAAAGADFVKTSTGFAAGGATVADVALLAAVPEIAAGRIRVKAAGGIRDAATARRLLAAGATRLGTSSGVAIVTAAGSEP